MSESNTNVVIAALAEGIILAQPQDLPALVGIHENLETIADLTADQFDANCINADRHE